MIDWKLIFVDSSNNLIIKSIKKSETLKPSSEIDQFNMFKFLIILLFSCLQLVASDKLLVCQVKGDTCTFTSKFLENNEKAIIVADHTAQGSSNADIKKVVFVSSSIYQIPTELFSTFLNLKVVQMHVQNVREIKTNTFINAKNLEELHLDSNFIEEISEKTFAGASNLNGLWMHANKIQSVHKVAFKNTKIVTIGFGGNQIREIHPETFYYNTDLIILGLEGSQLKTLHKNTFINNQKLTHLWLHSNQLNALSNTMFSHLKNLNLLRLDGNNCVNIKFETEAASHMAEIEAALRDCTISYLSLENDELKSELQEIKETISDGKRSSNKLLLQLVGDLKTLKNAIVLP
jgi:Leucine-rich repeat (LRR) protein